MFYPPFEGPRLKLGWARQKIEKLDAAINDYAARVKYGFREEEEPELPEMVVLRLIFSERPPADIALLTGDAVHNLRAALDVLIVDIARLRGVEDTSRLAFPFAESKDSLGKQIGDRRLSRLGSDIVTMLSDLKPYGTGDDANRMLSAINELDIVDKHHMIMPVFQAVPFDEIHAGPFSVFGMVANMRPGSTIPIRRGTPLQMRRQGGVTAIFPEMSPFPLSPVIEPLNQMAELTSGIIETFQAHLLANPASPDPPPEIGN